MNELAVVSRLFLAGVFAIAGLAKLRDVEGFGRSVGDFGVPAASARLVTRLVPVAEILCALSLLSAASVWWGAVGAIALLALFTLAIVVNLLRGRAPECHCFGQLRSAPIGWNSVVRNAVLAGLAALVLVQDTGGNAVGWAAGVLRVHLLAVSVAALAAFQVWTLLQLLQQNGRLMLRLEAVERRLGILHDKPGLLVGTPAPSFQVQALGGPVVTSAYFNESTVPTLLVFVDPGCGPCEELLPDIARWQRDAVGQLSVMVISRGDKERSRQQQRTYQLENMFLQTDREVADAFRASGTPSAVLVRSGAVASAVAGGAQEIRQLVLQTMSPLPLGRGEMLPPLQLPDLDGRTVAVSEILRDRPTLMVFWNPQCGYCQRMLEPLRVWEQTRPANTPEILLVSTGSQEMNRRQGLRSRALLDFDFAVGRAVGSTGTPSAVLVDADGRLASDVVVGAAAVFDLAGASPATTHA
jgi:thiol-disulfide isomerase/thioredoxin/uncharacterized membrane protein YphA (DoxX/SURF4 family)